MSARLKILENSLIKKEAELNSRFEQYFTDVRSANGQPLNDKRNGQQTLNRWERQSNGIRNIKDGIEKTKSAIESERDKISYTKNCYELMPDYLKKLIDTGVLKQWRKHPRIMFVEGVKIARIYFNEDTKKCTHKYVSSIECKEEYAIFRDVFNEINKIQTV